MMHPGSTGPMAAISARIARRRRSPSIAPASTIVDLEITIVQGSASEPQPPTGEVRHCRPVRVLHTSRHGLAPAVGASDRGLLRQRPVRAGVIDAWHLPLCVAPRVGWDASTALSA